MRGAEALRLKLNQTTVAVAYSRDGSRIATIGWGATGSGEMQVWDAATGTELATLKGHTRAGLAVALSPDGSMVVTTSEDRTAKVWRAQTGAELVTFRGHAGRIECAAFSPDGALVATGGADRVVRMWDAKTGSEVVAFKGHTDAVKSVAFNPDGSRLVSAGDTTARVWDVRASTSVITAREDAIQTAVFSQDGTRFATASREFRVIVWDARTGVKLCTIGHNNWVDAVAFSPDGTRVMTSNPDRVNVWDAKTGALIRQLQGEGVLRCVQPGRIANRHLKGRRRPGVGRSHWGAPPDARGVRPRGTVSDIQSGRGAPRHRAERRHRCVGVERANWGRAADLEGAGPAEPGGLVQPGRHPHRHRQSGQLGAGVGRADRDRIAEPEGAHRPGPIRGIQPRWVARHYRP